MAAKRYRGQHADVTWDADVCTHAGICIRDLPQVFDLDRKPWVLPDGAAGDALQARLREVVANCPSGALAMAAGTAAAEAPGVAATDASEAETVTIKVRQGGPLLVKGPVVITDVAGNVLRETSNVALCRCGATQNVPFCDGSHKDVELADPALPEE